MIKFDYILFVNSLNTDNQHRSKFSFESMFDWVCVKLLRTKTLLLFI